MKQVLTYMPSQSGLQSNSSNRYQCMSSMDLYMSDSGSTSCQQASSVKTLENKAEQNETKKPTEMLAELLLRFGYSLQHIHTD